MGEPASVRVDWEFVGFPSASQQAASQGTASIVPSDGHPRPLREALNMQHDPPHQQPLPPSYRHPNSDLNRPYRSSLHRSAAASDPLRDDSSLQAGFRNPRTQTSYQQQPPALRQPPIYGRPIPKAERQGSGRGQVSSRQGQSRGPVGGHPYSNRLDASNNASGPQVKYQNQQELGLMRPSRSFDGGDSRGVTEGNDDVPPPVPPR